MQEPESAKQTTEAVIVGKHTLIKDQTTVVVKPDPTNNGRVSMSFFNIPGKDNFTMSIPAQQSIRLALNLRQAAHSVLGIYDTKEQFKGGKMKHAIKEAKRARRARRFAEENQQLLDKTTKSRINPLLHPTNLVEPAASLADDTVVEDRPGIYKLPTK
jgi:hypothetical protein